MTTLHRIAALALSAFAAFASVPASAQQPQYVTLCMDPDRNIAPDVVIRACNTAIESGRWHGSALSWAFNNRGLAYWHKQDAARAIADYSRAIALDPRNADALYNRGFTYGRLREHDRAFFDIDAVVRLQPGAVDARVQRGWLFAVQGEYARAIIDYRVALRLDPQNADATRLLAAAQQALGDGKQG